MTSHQHSVAYTWIGDDCPPGWRRVGSIDIADPADVNQAIDRGYRIGTTYDGGTYSVAEPCTSDIYEEHPGAHTPLFAGGGE